MLAPTAGHPAPQLVAMPAPPVARRQRRHNASFGRRAAASIIDTFLLYFVQAALVVGGGAKGLGLSYVFSWLYKALLESSALQGTLGKRVLGIKVTDYNGEAHWLRPRDRPVLRSDRQLPDPGHTACLWPRSRRGVRRCTT